MASRRSACRRSVFWHICKPTIRSATGRTVLGFATWWLGNRLKLATAALLLSPYPPLLFMGEEYAETAPFHFFVSHGDPQLVERVRAGRRREFAALKEEPVDPQAESTFRGLAARPIAAASGPAPDAVADLSRAASPAPRNAGTLPPVARESWVGCFEEERILLSRSEFDTSGAESRAEISGTETVGPGSCFRSTIGR